jgi:hypothetical protein
MAKSRTRLISDRGSAVKKRDAKLDVHKEAVRGRDAAPTKP